MLYVTEIVPGSYPGPRLPMSYELAVAQQIQERMEQEVFQLWLARTKFLHKSGFPINQVIGETATSLACDTIVLGGAPVHGFQRWLGRNLSGAVLTQSPLSVFVVRATSLRMRLPCGGTTQAMLWGDSCCQKLERVHEGTERSATLPDDGSDSPGP